MRLFHKVVPLTAPRQPGEVVYTSLQLSRLRRSAINFQRFVMGALACFVIASVIFATASVMSDRAKAHDQCVSTNHSRAEIRQAFGKLGNAFVVATHGTPKEADAVAFKSSLLADLDKGLPQRHC
jgi:hypothetical protein